MADVFKKQKTVHTLNGATVPAGTPGATRRTELSRKWYGTVAGKQVPLCPDKQAARRLLAAYHTEAAKRAAGIGSPFEAHAAAPIGDHLSNWKADLTAKGTSAQQVGIVTGRCRTVLAGCGVRRIGDIDAPGVQRHLAKLRDADGKSVQTVNFYLNAVKQFCRWLVLNRRAAASPVAHLTGGNVKLDRRHDRRNLSAEELAALLAAARAGTPFWGQTGADREMLYRVAVSTGLRAAELASLTPESFKLGGDAPSVSVQAVYAKNRRADSIPLHPSLFPTLVACSPASPRAWPSGRASGLRTGAAGR